MRRQNWLGNTCLPFLVLSLMTLGVAQEKHRRIGEIDFYGYAGLDLDNIRAALPVREGDQLSDSDDAVLKAINRITETVKRVVGKPPTDSRGSLLRCPGQRDVLYRSAGRFDGNPAIQSSTKGSGSPSGKDY